MSHGEYVSLARVETTLLTNPNIDNICVYGNSNRDYLIALVVPNQKNLEQLADKVRIAFFGLYFIQGSSRKNFKRAEA